MSCSKTNSATVPRKASKKKPKEEKKGRTCRWPERLWHRDPYKVETIIFGGAKPNNPRATNKYDRMFEAAQVMKDPYDIGGDFIGTGKPKTAFLNYDDFLGAAVANNAVKDLQIRDLHKKRGQFWRELQEYLDRYKEHEEQLRLEWDIHMAYFTQIVGPIVEEALYINEMLNQMRNYFKAVSIWGQTQHDPWPINNNPDLGTPLILSLKIDAESPDYPGYNKNRFVEAKDARKSYFDLLGEGQDTLLGISILESIRRESQVVKKGQTRGKYRCLFGAFVRTDRPNGDPDCSGAKQSLEFAQILSEEMGRHILEQIPKYLPN